MLPLKKRTYKRLVMVVAPIALVALGWFLFLRGGGNGSGLYEFVKIDRGDLEAVVSSTGTLSAVTTVQVGTQVSGRIAKLYADFNQQVKQGQLLAMLDTAPLIQQVNEAESAHERARVQLKQSQMDYDRTAYLFKEKIKTQNDLDMVEVNRELAQATLKSAQSSLERARINLTYASIYSPIDGIVIARNVDVGQTVAASFSAPTLFLIANDLKKMQILANVDEADIGQIKESQPVRFTVQSFPDRKFAGAVTQIRMQPTTVQNVVNYTVVVQVDNTSGELLPGMTATIDFLIGQAQNVLRVPNAALRLKPTEQMMQALIKGFQERQKLRGTGEPSQRQGAAASGASPATRTNGTSGSPQWGGGGGLQRPKDIALLWYLDGKSQLQAARVRLGLSDGQMTEIKSGDVREGMEVIKAINTTDSAGSSTSDQSRGGARRPMFF